MWHEARKQERRIRGLIVDYRRRAERRQDFYEKIQADPTQFIQIHGRRCKIHLDPAVSAAGDGAAIIVPWQGQHDNLIDRFDVRAHLDYIPVVPKSSDSGADISQEERQCNYERYRILAQNDFLNVPEEKFLHQLYLEEQFGANAPIEGQSIQGKKKSQKSGAAIAYSYDDSTENVSEPQPFGHLKHSLVGGNSSLTSSSVAAPKPENESESDSDSDMDMDVSIEVSKLDTNQAHELNACGRNYGMLSNDFYSYLTKDADEADALRLAREEEREKILLGGRKSRRERRAQKERRIARRPFSPPSYAAKEDNKGKDEDSDSRSPSPSDTTEKITYITSFGGEDELQPHSKITITLGKGSTTLGAACVGASTSAASGQTTYAQKVKENLEKLKRQNTTSRRRDSRSRSYTRSRSRSRTRRRLRKTERKSRSRSTSYKRHRKVVKRSHTRSRSPSRSRSRSVDKISSSYSKRQRETCRRSRSRMHSRSHSNSRIRKRYSGSSPSSTGRRSISPLHTNYKTSRHTKRSPVSISSSRRKSRSSSRTNTRSSKTKEVGVKSPRKAIEALYAKQQDLIRSVSPAPSTTKSASNLQPLSLTESVASKQTFATVDVIEPPPPPLKRYYGRKKDEYSSSENMTDSDNEKDDSSLQTFKIKETTDVQDTMEVDTTSEKSNPLPSTSSMTYKEKPQLLQQQTGKYGTNTSNSNAPETKVSSISGVGGSSSCIGRLNLRERLKRKMQNLLNKQYKADKKAEIEKTERERQLQQERDEEMRELSIKLRRRQRELRHRYGSQNSKDSESDTSDKVEVTKLRRSKSRSSERSSVKSSRQKGREQKHQSPLTFKRSPSRERRRSPSRSSRVQRSRSQSRNRRSSSKRRRRSVSRSRRHREGSYEKSSRYNRERSRYDDRPRRSPSRSDRDRERDRERDRDRNRYRDREIDRNRYWGSSNFSDRNRSERGNERDRSDRDRYRDRYQPVTSSTTSSTSTSTSRSRVVISAPPKLKKLVDY